MSFVNPWFLLGGLAAAVPVLLHLIKRESAQKIQFSTLMFLRKISKRTIRYQKLRHLLLLLLRVLALLLLVLAFMRPFRDLPLAAAAPGRVTQAHVVMIDNSMSMAYQDRWDRARRAAAEIVRGAREGDKVALLEFSDRTVVLTQPATDFAAVLDTIETGTEITDRSTRYGQALKIAEKVALDSNTGKRTVYMISDFQKSGWAADERDFRLGSGIALQCIDVGDDSFSNLAIGDVQLREGEEAQAGGGLGIRFSLINFGTEDRNGTRLSLSVDGRVVGEKRADVAKGAVQGIEFTIPALISGMHDVALEVDDSRLTRDNRFSMTVAARGKIPVLAVERAGNGSNGRPPSFFVANALNISAFSPYRLESETPEQFASRGNLTSGLILWNNVSGGGRAVQTRLQEFVNAGGGLIVILADGTLAADFTRTFGSWLPVSVEEQGRQSRPYSATEYALMTDLRLDHPIFRPFDQPHSGTFSTARFFRHARLRVADGGEVLARFDNGDPALVAAAVGKGRVLVLPSSADDATNDLPLKPVFVPFWHQMLRFLENFRQDRQWRDVGDTIAPRKLLVEAAVQSGKRDVDLNQAIVVLDPSQRRVPLAPGSDALAVDMAGFYEIRTPDLRADVAVNPALRESDLSHGNSEEMAAGWISSEAKAAEVTSPDERPTAEEQDKRQRIWRILLLAVLAILTVEGLLANRFILKTE